MTAKFSVAEAYLELLAARGIEYLFLNAGTDFAPLVEAYARAPDTGLNFPRALPAAHENAAVCMAHGAYLMTGRPQAVMVHVNVGLANALMGVINASSDQIPMLFTSGRTPLTDGDMPGSRDEFIHWTQEMYDQGGMLREFVKWDYELRGGYQLQRVVDRALSIARSDPGGPVYLSLPREILASETETLASAVPSAVQPATSAAPDVSAVARAAEVLAAAERPLVITARSGRDPAAMPILARLAERYAWPVVEFRSNYVCLPGDHPLHGGHDVKPWLTSADAVLILEAPVPWLPKQARPPAHCSVIQVGADPLFQAYPVREFGRALNITASPAAFLAALEAALAGSDATSAEARRGATLERASALRPQRATPADDEPLSYAFASQCIDGLRTGETTIFNEIGIQRPYMSFTSAQDFFGSCMAGGLGWGLPAALGAKVAAPERTIIATLGDGSYMLSNPLACHQFSAAHELPFLTIIFNNVGWDSVRHAARLMYPDGHAAKQEWPPLSGLPPSPDFAHPPRYGRRRPAARRARGRDLPRRLWRRQRPWRHGELPGRDVLPRGRARGPPEPSQPLPSRLSRRSRRTGRLRQAPRRRRAGVRYRPRADRATAALPAHGRDRYRARQPTDAGLPRPRSRRAVPDPLARRLGGEPPRGRLLPAVGAAGSRVAHLPAWLRSADRSHLGARAVARTSPAADR